MNGVMLSSEHTAATTLLKVSGSIFLELTHVACKCWRNRMWEISRHLQDRRRIMQPVFPVLHLFAQFSSHISVSLPDPA